MVGLSLAALDALAVVHLGDEEVVRAEDEGEVLVSAGAAVVKGDLAVALRKSSSNIFF